MSKSVDRRLEAQKWTPSEQTPMAKLFELIASKDAKLEEQDLTIQLLQAKIEVMAEVLRLVKYERNRKLSVSPTETVPFLDKKIDEALAEIEGEK